MGKAKRTKTRQQVTPLGMAATTENECEGELSLEATVDGSPSTVTHVIENLQSTSADERDCGCAMLASLISQPGLISELLNRNVVKVVGPLMVDASLSIRQNAVGALRNLSVEGGCEACVEMVRQDVMTPLVTLLQQYYTNWRPSEEQCKADNLKQGTFVQAVHLLWNVCESSDVAAEIFTRQNLASILIPCLRPATYGYDICLAVAQCVHTVTEDNPRLVAQMAGGELTAHLKQLISTEHTSTEQLLLRTLATGILYNVSTGSLGTASGELLMSVVRLLTMVLSEDTCEALRATAKLITDKKGSSEGEEEIPDISDPTITKNDELDAHVQEVLHLISAQSIAVEMTANLCCPDDEEEEEDWEDLESDGGSGEESVLTQDGSVDEAAASGYLPRLCVPSEVHSAFVANNIIPKVLAKISFPEPNICDTLSANRKSMRVMRRWRELQSRSLLCLGNLVSAMETSSLGGVDQLHTMWLSLSQLSTSQSVLQEPEMLDAVTSAMRAVAQKISDSGSNKFAEVTSQDLQFLFEMGLQCKLDTVRANAVRIVSIVGCCLARPVCAHPLLKDIGLFLLESASKDPQLWVVAEALDAIFDVYAEDHLNSLMKEIGLVDKLQALVPYLRQKIKSDRKKLGEHLAIVSTARTNLVRFIKYKQNH